MTLRKRDISSEPEIDTKIRKIDQEEKDELTVIPILSVDILSEEIALEYFHVLEIKDKKKIGVIVKLLPPISEEFSHLKRVKDERILISPCKFGDVEKNILSLLCDPGIVADSILRLPVPAVKPHTKSQFEWAKKRWPTSFHPNKELESILSGQHFKGAEMERLRRLRKRALKTGCVIMRGDTELAVGSVGELLLEHSVMRCVSALARATRGADEYLATGCDVILDVEPCAMCAMALVHSRALRVFFCSRSANGVLANGHWQLHLESVLNHHYQVFELKECAMTKRCLETRCGERRKENMPNLNDEPLR